MERGHVIPVDELWDAPAPFSAWVDALRRALTVPSRRVDAEVRSGAQREHDAVLAALAPHDRTLGRRSAWIVAGPWEDPPFAERHFGWGKGVWYCPKNDVRRDIVSSLSKCC